MIALKFIGADNKEVRILVHEKIYVRHDVTGGVIEIFFSSTPAVKADKNAVTYNWSFRKPIREIVNYPEVEAFLNSIKKTDIGKPGKKGPEQATLDF